MSEMSEFDELLKEYDIVTDAVDHSTTMEVVWIHGQKAGWIKDNVDGSYTAMPILAFLPNVPLKLEAGSYEEALEAINGIAGKRVTAEENAVLLKVLYHLADKPECWSPEELRCMARIYNLINPTKPCKFASRLKSIEMSDITDDDEFDYAFCEGLGRWEIGDWDVPVHSEVWTDRYATFEQLRDSLSSQGELQPEDFNWYEYQEVGSVLKWVRTGIHPQRTAE